MSRAASAASPPKNDYHRVNGTDKRQIQADARTGIDADLLAGYDFGRFRLKAEAGYKDFRLRSLNSAVGVPYGNGIAGGTLSPIGGKNKIYSVMLNALLDFGGNDGPGVSIGGGAGWGGLIGLARHLQRPGFIYDKDSGFAWQGLIKLHQPITRNLDIGAEYRYFRLSDMHQVDQVGRVWSSDIKTHSLLGTLTLNFGAAPPPPPPPPPPPAAASAAASPAASADHDDVSGRHGGTDRRGVSGSAASGGAARRRARLNSGPAGVRAAPARPEPSSVTLKLAPLRDSAKGR